MSFYYRLSTINMDTPKELPIEKQPIDEEVILVIGRIRNALDIKTETGRPVWSERVDEVTGITVFENTEYHKPTGPGEKYPNTNRHEEVVVLPDGTVEHHILDLEQIHHLITRYQSSKEGLALFSFESTQPIVNENGIGEVFSQSGAASEIFGAPVFAITKYNDNGDIVMMPLLMSWGQFEALARTGYQARTPITTVPQENYRLPEAADLFLHTVSNPFFEGPESPSTRKLMVPERYFLERGYSQKPGQQATLTYLRHSFGDFVIRWNQDIRNSQFSELRPTQLLFGDPYRLVPHAVVDFGLNPQTLTANWPPIERLQTEKSGRPMNYSALSSLGSGREVKEAVDRILQREREETQQSTAQPEPISIPQGIAAK